jgi:hypothetical protein
MVDGRAFHTKFRINVESASVKFEAWFGVTTHRDTTFFSIGQRVWVDVVVAISIWARIINIVLGLLFSNWSDQRGSVSEPKRAFRVCLRGGACALGICRAMYEQQRLQHKTLSHRYQ